MKLWRKKKTTCAELEKLVAIQQQKILELEQQVLQLQAENAELKKLLGKGSPPPSAPSGMVPPYKKPPAKRRRQTTLPSASVP